MTIFNSATRVVLIMLVGALVAINLYGMTHFENEKFSLVFTLFKDVTLLVCGAFFMKSTSDQKAQPTVDETLKEALSQ